MPNRKLFIRENGRVSARGIFRDSDGIWSVFQDPDAALDYTLDWSKWLGTDTISSATFTGEGLTVDTSSNTTTTTTATVSGTKAGNSNDYGGVCEDFSELKTSIVTAASLKQDLTIRFYGREM